MTLGASLPKVVGDASVELVAGLQQVFAAVLLLQALFDPLQGGVARSDLLRRQLACGRKDAVALRLEADGTQVNAATDTDIQASGPNITTGDQFQEGKRQHI